MAGRSTCCTRTSPRSTRRWSRGALALAVLNAATLVSAGHPWNISFGYTLWGGKLAAAAGVDLSAYAFWTWPFPSRALAGSVFADVTRSEEHTSELQSLMRISYAVFCLKKKTEPATQHPCADID